MKSRSRVAARHAAMPSDREVDAAAGALHFLGDLRARGAGAGDQYSPRRKLFRIAVLAGMDLKHPQLARQLRHQSALIGTGGDDDIVRLDRAVRGLGDEAGAAVPQRQPRHLDAAADRRRDEFGIGVDELDDVGRAGEPVRVAVRKRKIRQPHRPVRKLELQAVPALAAPALRDPLPFQHQMRQPALLEAVAHDQASLAAADHEGRYLFIRHGGGPCDARRVQLPRE